jgi:hypothetical protein
MCVRARVCVCVCVKIGTFPIIIGTQENKINVKISESKNTTVYAHSGHKLCIFSTRKKAICIIYYKLVETATLMLLEVILNRSFCCT